MRTNVIYNQECLKGMSERIPDNSIDMILADLPYGTTACKWDSIIPLEPLWEQYKRIVKNDTAIVLTASQPFTTKLIQSNMDWFKYIWIWDKKIPSGMSYARYQPMRQHEDIVIFGQGRTKYNPQKTKRDKPISGYVAGKSKSAGTKGYESKKKTYTKKNPTTIITFKKKYQNTVHPTQKPVALFKYLIKTYTNEGDIVLDNAIGSGTTAVAAKALDRKYIGFEKEEKYVTIARKRIKEVQKELI